MKLLNCTPHPIVVRKEDGSEITFEPSGILPRITTIDTEAETINGIPCISQTQGEVSGLPNPEIGTFLIIPIMVFNTVVGRSDLVAPDTGKGAIRDERGRILGVTRFIRR